LDSKTQTDEPFRKSNLENQSSDPSPEAAVELLEQLLLDERYPANWIKANIQAIATGDYQPLARLFYDEAFIGEDGHFVLAAPFTVVREAVEDTKFSLLVGRVIFRPESDAAIRTAERLQDEPLREEVNAFLATEVEMATGNLNGPNGGEAFVVPDGFEWARKTKEFVLPAINNATEQFRRVSTGFKCIERIFEPVTARALVEPIKNWESFVRIQNTEYLLHDIGHHAGIGLNFKLDQGLLPTYWLQGQEECRADAMEFAILAETFIAEEAKAIIASNFVTRFGIDAHRQGGIDGDYDVTVVLWLLDHLLKSNSLYIKGGQLGIRNVETDGLLRAVEGPIIDGLERTREELKLERKSGLARLYNFTPNKFTLEIFREFVLNPCRDLATGLR
jgi:hypothetical protein